MWAEQLQLGACDVLSRGGRSIVIAAAADSRHRYRDVDDNVADVDSAAAADRHR